MRRAALGGLLPLAAFAAGCSGGDGEPLDKLKPYLVRSTFTAPPTAEEIATACGRAEAQGCTDDPGNGFYCEPVDSEYVVRAPKCGPVRRDPSALACRFGATSMPFGAPAESYRGLRDRDFEEHEARFVRVAYRRQPREPLWIVAGFCRRTGAVRSGDS